MWQKLQGTAVAPDMQPLERVCCSEAEAAQRLRSEKTALLYENSWQPILIGAMAAVLLTIAMAPLVPAGTLYGWLGTLLTISVGRVTLGHAYYRAGEQNRQRPCWMRWFVIGVIASGSIWGLGALLMFHADDPDRLAILMIIMIGMMAGSIVTLSAVWWVATAFFMPIALPLLWCLFQTESPNGMLLAMLLVLFVGLIFMTSGRLAATIHANLALRLAMASREARLMESENRYRSIFERSPLGVIHFSRSGEITDCNRKMPEILGVESHELIGYNMLHPAADKAVAEAVRKALAEGSADYEGTYHLPGAAEGTPLRAFFNAVHSTCNQQVGGVAIIEDFTERKRQEALIYRQAYYDSLTGLPNRRMFIERIEDLWGKVCGKTRRGMLVFLDLDRFKLINDSLGHAAGDDLLVQVSRRLEATVVEGDMVARLSGDEFVLMALFDEENREAIEARAEAYAGRVQQALVAPYRLGGQQLEVTPSIGYTCIDTREGSCAEALRQADIAMYGAKVTGRNRLCRYHPAMETRFQAEARDRAAELAGDMALDRR